MITNAIATSRPISGGKPSAATGPDASTNTSAASAPGSRKSTSRRPVGHVDDRRRVRRRGAGSIAIGTTGGRHRGSIGAPERGGGTRSRPVAVQRPAADQQVCHEARPAGLVRGADAGAGVAVEVLVEQQQVAPLGVVAELRDAPATGRCPSASGQPDRDQPRGQVGGHVPQPQAPPDPVGYSTVKRLAQRLVPAQQRLDEQVVDREPDRAAPVRVAAEQVVRRLAGLVVDRRVVALDLDPERLVEVAPGQGPQAVRREEPVLGQRLAQHALEPHRRQQAEDHLVAARRVDDRAAVPERRHRSRPCRPGSARSACPARRPARSPSRGTATAGRIGSRPTIEWILSGTAVPSGSRSGS